jgi:hypothetical protein
MMQLIIGEDICAFIHHESFKTYMLCHYYTLSGVLSTATFVIARFPQSLNLPVNHSTGNTMTLKPATEKQSGHSDIVDKA